MSCSPTPSSEQLQNAFSSLGRPMVLVVGDVILDEYLWGTAGRISPEAPVPVVLVQRNEYRPGGAANVAYNLASLDIPCRLLSVLGSDTSRQHLEVKLSEFPQLEFTPTLDEMRPTPHKCRLMAGHQQVVRIDRESSKVSQDARARLVKAAIQHMDQAEVLVLSDYFKGCLDADVCRELISAARAHAIHVVVDPKGTDFKRYAGASLLTPNLKELHLALGLDDSIHDEARISIIQEFLSAHNIAAMALTMGEQGILMLGHQTATHISGTAQQVYDVTGAGDTVVALAALGLAGGLSSEIIASLANWAAGLVVAKVGSAALSRAELSAALAGGTSVDTGALCPLDNLLAMRRQWANEGRQVVFTNGCFDLLHHGHVSLLARAAQEGQLLVVGLNSDASVKRLKGDERPFVPLEQRAAVLAALSVVDYVVSFDQDTPANLIKALLPDVLVKGGDYLPQQVVGRQTVEDAGGRLVIVPLVDGTSSTNIAKRIQAGS